MNSYKVISFSSGKGGVGKTSLVANMGTIWSKTKKTLLVDGDWNLGKLNISLGVRPTWTIEKVIEGKVSLKDAVCQVGPNLDLIASPTGVVGFEEMNEEARNQIFFELEALFENYELVLFDHASGIDWSVLQFAAASHQHVIVTTPEPTSYTDAYAIMKILSKRFQISRFLMLATMSQDGIRSEGIMERFLDVAHTNLDVVVKLLDILPWEPRFSDSSLKQKAFVDLFPEAVLSKKLERACTRINSLPLVETGGLKFSSRVSETV